MLSLDTLLFLLISYTRIDVYHNTSYDVLHRLRGIYECFIVWLNMV